MLKDVEMIAGLTELIDFSKRVANAASQLASVRETDVEIAQTPREEIHALRMIPVAYRRRYSWHMPWWDIGRFLTCRTIARS
jgi:hypothetical protein